MRRLDSISKFLSIYFKNKTKNKNTHPLVPNLFIGFNSETGLLGTPHLIGTVVAAILIFVIFSILCFCLCKYCVSCPFRQLRAHISSAPRILFTNECTCLDTRYQRQQLAALRRKAMAAPELQLSRLRGPSSSMVSEYNPNYEFGSGAPCSVQGLKEIPRENLRLVRLVTTDLISSILLHVRVHSN